MEQPKHCYSTTGESLHEKMNIFGIPTYIVPAHHHSFLYWENLRNATKLQIDAHPDMDDKNVPTRNGDNHYYRELYINNFNCAAVHHGIVSSLYWLNPHSEKRRLQDMGTTRLETGRILLNTIEKNEMINWYFKTESKMKLYRDIVEGIGENIKSWDMWVDPQLPFILDIDLDGFCSLYEPYNSHFLSEYVRMYDDRIKGTETLLGMFKRPDVITITPSQENGVFVPPKFVPEVLNMTIEMLENVYGNSSFNNELVK